jgi:hypothetical protein
MSTSRPTSAHCAVLGASPVGDLDAGALPAQPAPTPWKLPGSETATTETRHDEPSPSLVDEHHLRLDHVARSSTLRPQSAMRAGSGQRPDDLQADCPEERGTV